MAPPHPAPVGIILPDPYGLSDQELEVRVRALLRLARASHVSLIHTGDGPAAARTERAIGPLLEPPGPWALIVGRPLGGAPAQVPTLPGGAREWLRISVELVPSASADGRIPLPPPRPIDLVAPGEGAPWGVAARSAAELLPLRDRMVAEGAAWARFPFHLLNAPELSATVDAWSARGIGVVADDPFAGGLLDGQWLSGSPLDSPGVPRGLDWEATRRRLAPVTGLGYLTGPRRTLPQAALDYLRGRAGVSAVLVRVASAADFEKLAPPKEPLDEAERRRVEAGAPAPPDPAPRTPSNTPGR